MRHSNDYVQFVILWRVKICLYVFVMSLYIRNLSSGDVLTYSLPILVGDVRPSATETVIIVNNKQSTEPAISWPVIDGKFKVLVDLFPGENEIELRTANVVTLLTLYLIPPRLTKFVRPIYICCKDDPGEFQGPDDEDRSPSSAVRRIALSARLVSHFICVKVHCRYDLHKYYFTNRVVPVWNSLPNDVVIADNIDVFKKRLDKFWSSYVFVYIFRAQPLETRSVK